MSSGSAPPSEGRAAPSRAPMPPSPGPLDASAASSRPRTSPDRSVAASSTTAPIPSPARPAWLPNGMPDLSPLMPQQREIARQFRAHVEKNARWSVVPDFIDEQRSLFFYKEDLDLMRSLALVSRGPVLERIPGIFGAPLTAIRGFILRRINHVLRYWLVRQTQLNESLVSAAARTAALEHRLHDVERQLAELRAGGPS